MGRVLRNSSVQGNAGARGLSAAKAGCRHFARPLPGRPDRRRILRAIASGGPWRRASAVCPYAGKGASPPPAARNRNHTEERARWIPPGGSVGLPRRRATESPAKRKIPIQPAKDSPAGARAWRLGARADRRAGGREVTPQSVDLELEREESVETRFHGRARRSARRCCRHGPVRAPTK